MTFISHHAWCWRMRELDEGTRAGGYPVLAGGRTKRESRVKSGGMHTGYEVRSQCVQILCEKASMSDRKSTKTGPFFSSGPIPNADTSQALYLRFDPRTHKSERKLSFPNFTVGKSRHFLFATHMCAKAISSALSSSMKLDWKKVFLLAIGSEVHIYTANNSDA